MPMNAERLLDRVRRANNGVALLVGLMLSVTALFILVDITLRQFGGGLGGSDEIGGYAMAVTASWGLAYALVEMAHVRIDLLHRRAGSPLRAGFDLIAIASMTATVCLIAYLCWPVLEKSISRGSRANTPLETPLWIPQSLWFGGWLWFAISTLLMLIAAIALLRGNRRDSFDRWFAATDELATLERSGPVSPPADTPEQRP